MSVVDSVVPLNYISAVREAIRHSLTTRPEVIVYGEDVGRPGGVFGATRGLQAEFGERVFDTPISESAILGSAIGAAMVGMRPIVEIMWIEFLMVAFDQLVNQASNVRYISRGELAAPITVRTQQGVLPGACAQHSQNLEALVAHIPGLRVGLPSNPQDAYTMLLQAVASDDPVVVIENRSLYFVGPPAEVDLTPPTEPLGRARIPRPGTDLTIVTWSAQVDTALAAADRLELAGASVEVVDLRWLNPLDIGTILESVGKTGRLIVLQEANTSGGFGAEVAARVADEGISLIDASIVRIGLADTRIPAAPVLQKAVLPNPELVASVASKLLDLNA